MCRQIVHDKIDALVHRVATSDGSEEVQDDGGVFPGLVVHPQDILMETVGGKEIADTAVAMVGRPMAHRMLLQRPRGTGIRLDLHRAKFIKADYDRVFRRPIVESVDAFFLEVNSGSFDSFQVRVR